MHWVIKAKRHDAEVNVVVTCLCVTERFIVGLVAGIREAHGHRRLHKDDISRCHEHKHQHTEKWEVDWGDDIEISRSYETLPVKDDLITIWIISLPLFQLCLFNVRLPELETRNGPNSVNKPSPTEEHPGPVTDTKW
jgi:hypothetical protein